MKKSFFLCLFFTVFVSFCVAQESFPVWPDRAPGEKEGTKAPTYELWKPKVKKSDSCLIVCPGGAYNALAYVHEGKMLADYFNEKGRTVVVLKYRVPRRAGLPKHIPAWQDAQRTVRLVRSHAKEWGIDPEKIGIMGFSAGGHLTLMTSTTSQTKSYDPIDELDKISPHVNFAIPVYPAYVLEPGKKDNNCKMVADFAFDAKTPPMCLIHGDKDPYSPMGSATVYHKLRTMKIPAELHIYANVGHGFGAAPKDEHLGDWMNRVYVWMNFMGF